MSSHFKVHEVIKDSAELAELESYAREPGRTIDEIHEWLLARGYTLSRTAVGNWKRKLDEIVMQERFSRSGELARAMQSAIDRGGIEAVAEGATKQMTQVVFEQVLKLEQDGEVDPLDVQRWSLALKRLIGSKREIEDLKERYESKQAAAVAEAEKVAAAGGDGRSVVDKVRELLGMKS